MEAREQASSLLWSHACAPQIVELKIAGPRIVEVKVVEAKTAELRTAGPQIPRSTPAAQAGSTPEPTGLSRAELT